MNKMKSIWIALAAVFFGISANAAAPEIEGAAEYRIIVFKSDVPMNRGTQMIQSFTNVAANGKIVHNLPLIHGISILVPTSKIKSFQSQMAADPRIERIEKDFKQNWLLNQAPALSQVPFNDISAAAIKRNAEVQVPELSLPAAERGRSGGSSAPWGIQYVKAEQAWKATKGAGVRVGVIDTGIDYDHPYLRSNIKGGWNAISGADSAADFKDDNGHGTHVAGTIAAKLNPSNGVVGVAPEASLYGIKVLDAGGSGTFADVIAGIQWAVDNRLDVVNMSLGAGSGLQSLQDAVKAAARANVTIIAAAGNSGGSVGYPAAYPEVIAISAMDKFYHLADFSSRGPEVAFTAPGVDINSTYMGGGYKELSGTSMACPHAVGLATLAIAAHGVQGSTLLRRDLTAAATFLPTMDGPRDYQGAGLIDARKLVEPLK